MPEPEPLVAQLRDALLGVATKYHLKDGTTLLCWCRWSPLKDMGHSPSCINARNVVAAAVAALRNQEGA